LEVDGKRVDNSSKLKLLISSNRPGDETKLLILSNKNKKTVYVTLDKYPEDNISQKPEKDFDLLGVIVSDGNGKGVEIKKIDKKSNAYRSGLRTGDLILSIDNQKINTKSDYKKLVNDLKQGDIVMMQTSRNGRKTFIAFNIN